MAPLAGLGGIAGACAVAGLSRAGFYRHFEHHAPAEAQMEVRDLVQRTALQHRSYGYRRVQAALRTQGVILNHKRVLRILREDNLLSLRRRRYVLTTDSRHPYFVYPNLAGALVLERCDQLWVADITYIRLGEAFVYLAVTLDAFSRRVIGWELGETLEAKLAIAALRMALCQRQPAPGWMHHSDRGTQYCCRDYVHLIETHGGLISMSRRANPYDNAKAESFMKTLKAQEVYLREYRNIAEARLHIGAFLDQAYNRERLHSALGYLSPQQFELQTALIAPGATA